MRWLAAVVPLLLVAGCASPSAEPAPAVEAPTVVTDPRDLANGTTPGSHVHDYWDGSDRALVVEEETDAFSAEYGGSDRGFLRGFQPPDGSIVPQGTGIIEGVLDWTLADPLPSDPLVGGSEFTRMELWVQTAEDSERRPVVLSAEKGVPFRFNVTGNQSDPPHYTLTLWTFGVVAANDGGDRTAFSGSLRLKIEAVRTLDLPVFPPHPDPWKGNPELPLTARDVTVMFYAESPVTQGCLGGACVDTKFGPDPGKVVPFDASAVQVTIATDPSSAPVMLGLQWHGADTRTMTPAILESESQGLRTFRIEIGPSVGDSPYAKQSLWEFRVHLDAPEETGAWTGTFHVAVKALR